MSASDVLKMIKDKEAEFVDLRFTDPRGKLQHLTMDSAVVDEDMLNQGVFFDGSSIAGWKAINESDMILKPDTARMFKDPFTSHNTVVLFCDILDKSGFNIMSDSFIAFQPAIEEPSKNTPSFSIPSSATVVSIVKCCSFPLGSVNLRSKNSTSLSLIIFKTSLALIFYSY